MNAVSAIVDKNAVGARQMQATTNAVLTTIAPIAGTAAAQAETADAVSAATAELAAQVAQMNTTAGELRAHAASLTRLVEMFGGLRAGPAAGAPRNGARSALAR